MILDTLFVVLNSESGDAQLSVYIEDETSSRQESLLSVSSHNDYIPDVVKITKSSIGKGNLIGKYRVKVYPETFSIMFYMIKIQVLSILITKIKLQKSL